jgi:hypothetical protein
MEQYNERLEELRLEFLKRAEITNGSTLRAEWAMERSKEPALTIHPHSTSTDGPRGHGYKMTITFNLYKTEQEIIEAFISEVVEKNIRWNKRVMEDYDNPESKKPILKKGKGHSEQRSLKEIEECLKIYDLHVSGLTNEEIVGEVYDNFKRSQTEINSWDTDRNKVNHKIKNALSLIESAKNNTFPKYT